MYIPHVGDEVIVDFLEGDPDRPIVTGRVYNANRMPPLTLPANDKKSIFRDHYGNELVFDGTPGSEHISLHSPSKFSVLQLGKSVRTFTGSTEVSCSLKARRSYTLGDSMTFTRGAALTMTRGAWFNVKFGAGVDVGMGAACTVWGVLKVNFAAGLSIDITKTSKLTFTYDNLWNAAAGNLSVRSEKDVLIDSQKTLRMTGGKNDNTLIEADDGGLTVSFDPSNSGRDMTKLGARAKAIAGGSAAILAGAAGMAAWQYVNQMSTSAERQNGTTREIDAEVSQLEGYTTGDLTTYGGVALGTLAGAFVGKPTDAPEPKHPGPTSALQVKDDFAVMWAGKAKDATLELSKERGVKVETEKNIVLDSQGAIAYKAAKNIDIKANQANFDAIIKHKNLTVLK